MNNTNKDNRTSIWKFIIPSLSGILLFMIPIKYNDSWTLAVKVLADLIAGTVSSALPLICMLIVTGSAIVSLLVKFKPALTADRPLLKSTFHTTLPWLIVRVLGALFILIAFFFAGSENSVLKYIVDSNTGTFILNDLLTTLVIIFAIAALLLPLLLDFGLPEFIGALFTRIMRPLFTIPGRAAVDSLTSWIGDGSLGVLLTLNQYERGFYSKREAAVIATTFSAVSITFSIVVLSQVKLLDYFGLYYLTVCLCGIVCALILPRIPPLSRFDNEYLIKGQAVGEDLPAQYRSSFGYGIALARGKAGAHTGLGQFFSYALKNVLDMWFGVLPVVMCIGTLALIISNYTPVFNYLGLPFLPLLEALQIPEAEAASKTMLVGFTDMFIPSIMAAEQIQSEMTRFIIAAISVTQLIYLSEIGGLILGSKIPLGIFGLFVIFLERTIISLLIITPIAHLIF